MDDLPTTLHVRAARVQHAPKVPIGWIVQLYQRDALGIRDDEMVDRVGWRLYERCRAVLLVSDSRVACPVCQTLFPVPWVGQPPNRVSVCPGCGWSITARTFHESFEHQDLNGGNAREAFEEYLERYDRATGYRERMLAIDRVIHALHRSGGLAARNLLEGRPRQVLAILDELAR